MEKTEMNQKPNTRHKMEIRKAPLSVEADEALLRMVETTNKGFQGGRVNRADLLSWLVLYFEKNSYSNAREDIRKRYFDKASYLTSVLDEVRKAQRDGRLEPDIQSLLAPLSEIPVITTKE